MPIIDTNDADYSVECVTCQELEAEAARHEDRGIDRDKGHLSEGGNNVTKRQAGARAAAHLRKHPTHEVHWTAMGRARRP